MLRVLVERVVVQTVVFVDCGQLQPCGEVLRIELQARLQRLNAPVTGQRIKGTLGLLLKSIRAKRRRAMDGF